MRRSKATFAGLAAVGAIALAVPALAQDAGETPDTTQEQIDEQEAPDRHGAKLGRLAEELAAELDLPVEDVQAALEAVHDRLREERRAARLTSLGERLDEAVEAGDLTQEQADAILEAAEAGVLKAPGRHRGDGHVGPWGRGPRT